MKTRAVRYSIAVRDTLKNVNTTENSTDVNIMNTAIINTNRKKVAKGMETRNASTCS